MDRVDVELRVRNEIGTLAIELADRWERVYHDKGSKRFIYIAAQVALCESIMTATTKQENWESVPPLLDRYREKARLEYEEASEEESYEVALPMLGRLRFLTTLTGRIADTRRMRLFKNEQPGRPPLSEESCWIREFNLIFEEALANAQRVESQGNEARHLMALAPVYLAEEMAKQLSQMEDWSGFKESIYDYIESETERYRLARDEDDRRSAWVMLARVRFAKTLAWRLDNPRRREWGSLIAESSPTRH